MPSIHACRKCGREYSLSELNESKFCKSCGTFLSNTFYGSQTEQDSGYLPVIAKKQSNEPFWGLNSREHNHDLHEDRPKEETKILEDGQRKRIITYSDPSNIRKLVALPPYSSFTKFKLNLQARELKAIGAFDRLLSVDAIRTKLEPYPFQMRTALHILQDMNANAILADEVGLGKTIEAGLILKELVVRSLAKSILIIVPKSLTKQWQDEMLNKFGGRFVRTNDRSFIDFGMHDKIICSFGLLKTRIKDIERTHWELVIVDEAHTFRNIHSKGREKLALLPHDHLLLLTATPLCNKLNDLYSIVDLVDQGLLETENAFVSRYAADAKCRTVKPEMTRDLQHELSKVMCRTRRTDTDIPFSHRFVESRRIEAEDFEYRFIDEATNYLKDISQNRFKTIDQLEKENPSARISEAKSKAILIFQAITLQQSISSSPYAAIESLNKRYDKYPTERAAIDKLRKMAEQIKDPSKIQLLKNVIKEIDKEQAIIFCS